MQVKIPGFRKEPQEPALRVYGCRWRQRSKTLNGQLFTLVQQRTVSNWVQLYASDMVGNESDRVVGLARCSSSRGNAIRSRIATKLPAQWMQAVQKGKTNSRRLGGMKETLMLDYLVPFRESP